MTGKPDEAARKVCDNFGLNERMRPPENMLNILVKYLSADTIVSDPTDTSK